MKRKFNKFDKFKGKDGLSIDQLKFEGGVPSKEKVSSGSEHFDYVAFRDLSFHGAIEPHADPNTEAGKGSYPYAILNRTNRVLEANYPGYQNISGNSIVRLQNSVSSQFLNYFDSIVMIKRLNYLYLTYDSNGTNAAYNYEMVKAIEQALAYGYSTMLTQLPFYYNKVTTNLPRVSGSPFYGEENDTYDRMGALLHYQIVMQNIVSPLAKYVETLSLEEDLMDMSYRREAPIIQQLFGQLKKKAFIAQLNSVGTVVIGEYFDTNWWKQMNALRHVPSREANDMNHALITMVTSHYIPQLKLYASRVPAVGEDPYYDSDVDLVYTVAANTFLDPETFEKSAKTNWTLEEIIVNLNKLMDAHYILTWARKLTSGILSVSAIKEASAYYQAIYLYISALSYIASRFGSKMTELRTFLDKLCDTGMVYWKKGIKFDISKVFPKSLTYNQIVADVLKSTLSGAKTIRFDANTLRWVCNTEWNMYTGINKFDKFSGGSFLTFSVRDVSLTDTAGNTIDKTSSTMLIPILFNPTPVFQPEASTWAPATGHVSQCVKTVTRLGLDVYLDTYEITNANIDTDKILSRLNPLGDTTLSIKAPNFNENHFDDAYSGLSTAEVAHIMSALNKVLLQIAQYDRLTKSTEVIANVDPDLIAIIDLQVEDVSNAMIQFARNYSPFRVNTLDGKRTIGFGSSGNDIAA